ncbi:unnamed protein product [Symbiodinium natans]|uniref:Uncharacterized protein n=1 Tax=Symbiodinium natans TaxID=878477 RepID=A0A812Q108_9DINO|nr:unnamed protein product [Symbiodinium natans]
MLRIRMLSGEEVSMPLEEVSCVREAKRRLHHVHGLLLLHGTNLDDADELGSPLELHLVLLSFAGTSQTQANDLVAAARAGSVDKVEAMLRLPQDPNLADEDDRRPILEASGGGHVEVVRLLVEAGADKDVPDVDGCTALSLAAAEVGCIEVVRLLVEAGADKDLADNNGNRALMWAAIRGNTEVAHLLVEAGADKDLASNGGYTALMSAAAIGHRKLVRLLEEAPESAPFVSGTGRTDSAASKRRRIS